MSLEPVPAIFSTPLISVLLKSEFELWYLFPSPTDIVSLPSPPIIFSTAPFSKFFSPITSSPSLAKIVSLPSPPTIVS